jgi:thiol-disulfide isomerase/thioredoxin
MCVHQPGIFEERIKYLDKNKPVYTYCLVGGRSAAAAARLREEGFKEVYNLQGGITAWKKAELPVEGRSPAPPITMDEYLARILAGKTVLVDIGAEWCPPCKKMEPVLKEIAVQKKDAVVMITIDGGAQEKLAAALNAATLPTFIIYKNGKETWRQAGIVSKEVLLQQLD